MTERLAKRIEGPRAVELRAGNVGQVECVSGQVGKITITDGLLAAIARPATARTAERGIETVQVATGGYPCTPCHEGNPEVLQFACRVMRGTSATMIGSQDHQRVAAQRGVVSDGVEDTSEQLVRALDGREVWLAHEPARMSNSIRQGKMDEGERPRFSAQLGG